MSLERTLRRTTCLFLVLAGAACGEPEPSASRFAATLDPAQALEGEAVVVWYVSPESGHVHGNSTLEGQSFVARFSKAPPDTALFKAAAGIGVPAILAPGTALPDGPLDASALAALRPSVLASSEATVFVWVDGSVLQGGWIEAFGGGFGCGRCLPSGDSTDYQLDDGPVLAPMDCDEMRFEVGSVCPGFVRVPDNAKLLLDALPSEPVDLGTLGTERLLREGTVPSGSAAVFGLRVEREDVFTVTVRATGNLEAVLTLAGIRAAEFGFVVADGVEIADGSGVVYATSDTLQPTCTTQWLRGEVCYVYFVVGEAAGAGGPDFTFDLAVEPGAREPFVDEGACPLPYRRISQCESAGTPAFDGAVVALSAPQLGESTYGGLALRNAGAADSWLIVTAVELEASSPQLSVLEPRSLLALASGDSVPISVRMNPAADLGCDLAHCGWLVVHTFGEADSSGLRVPIAVDNSAPRIWALPEEIRLQPQGDQDVVVSIANVGEASLGLLDISLMDGFEDLFLSAPSPLPVLRRDESAQITLSYRPAAPASGMIDTVRVRSTSTWKPDLMIPVELVASP